MHINQYHFVRCKQRDHTLKNHVTAAGLMTIVGEGAVMKIHTKESRTYNASEVSTRTKVPSTCCRMIKHTSETENQVNEDPRSTITV